MTEVSPDPLPGETSLDAVWQRLLAADPLALCVAGGAQEWSRCDFEQEIRAQVAALSTEGVAAGDVLAWLGLNSAQMLATLFACGRVGAVFLPLNWRLTDEELRAAGEGHARDGRTGGPARTGARGLRGQGGAKRGGSRRGRAGQRSPSHHRAG